jgi:hypothetical protein
MNRITLDDLEALTRTETEILALPSTESHDFEPLESSAEYGLAKHQSECDLDNLRALIVHHCEGVQAFCLPHAIAVAKRLRHDEHLIEAHGGEGVTPCPKGCGQPQAVCWTPLVMDMRVLIASQS